VDRGDHIQIKRLADGAGFLGTVEDGQRPDGRRQGEQEVRRRERAEQADLLEKYEKEWQDLTKYDLESLNNQAKTLAYPVVIVPPKEKKLP